MEGIPLDCRYPLVGRRDGVLQGSGPGEAGPDQKKLRLGAAFFADGSVPASRNANCCTDVASRL